MLARVLERIDAVAGEQIGDDEVGAVGERLENLAAITGLGAQQRSAVQLQHVEGPELDAGRPCPVLHLAEARAPPFVERHHFAVEHHVMVGQIGGQQLQ